MHQASCSDFSQERAYVTGLRAANMVVRQLGFGQEAEILQASGQPLSSETSRYLEAPLSYNSFHSS